MCGKRIIGRDAEDEMAAEEQARAEGTVPATTAEAPPPASPPAASDDLLVVELDDEPGPVAAAVGPDRPAGGRTGAATPVRATPVSGEYVGRPCPYCRFPLKVREQMILCPACQVAHHVDCWRENGGCTTYGCAYAPEAHPPQPAQVASYPARPRAPGPARPVPGALPNVAAATAAASIETAAMNALVLSLLGLFSFAVLSLVGLVLAFNALVRMKVLGLNLPSARAKAIAAIALAVAIAGFWGLLVFSMASGGPTSPW